MASQNPPYNPAPAQTPAHTGSPAPPSYSHHDPNHPSKPEATYQPHPQAGYQQQPTYVTTLGRLQDQPELVDCPFCHKQAMTRVAKEDSSMTMVAGGLLCLVCICLTCLPCMLGWCQNVDHFCSACGKQLTHKPHDGTLQITEAAKEAQNRMGVQDGQQRGPAYGQVPSQYGQPPAQQQQPMQPVSPMHTGEYGSAQQQHGQPMYNGGPGNIQQNPYDQQHQQQRDVPEIQMHSPPQSPPVVHQEKA